MVWLAIAVWAVFAVCLCLGLHNWAKRMEAYDAATTPVRTDAEFIMTCTQEEWDAAQEHPLKYHWQK